MNSFTVLSNTPFGEISLAVRNGLLVGSAVGYDPVPWRAKIEKKYPELTGAEPDFDSPIVQQVDEYFRGVRQNFEIPIDWTIFTPFQADVMRLVRLIPYGETRYYGQIAKTLDNPKASRAVGRANATNPVPIILPCHRVIGKSGKMVGYNAPHGIAVKEWLLKFEGAIPVGQMVLL